MISNHLQHCILGISEVDSDHIRLLHELHDLINLVRNEQPYEEAVTAIKRNMRNHFEREDELMKKIKYPFIAAHKRDHANLLDLIDKFSSQVRIGNSLAYATMVVENIFADHIVNFDRQYADFMRHNYHKSHDE